jgi:hypothetical protein
MICFFIGFDIGLKESPQSGSIILDLASNSTTLSCSIVADKNISLLWSLQYVNGTQVQPVLSSTAPDLFNVTISDNRSTYIQSHFQILNLISDLDGVTVFCGTKEEHQLANFTYRIYRKLF